MLQETYKSARYDTVRHYMAEIARTPLLTAEQEIELGKQVQAWQTLVETKSKQEGSLNRSLTLAEWAELTETCPNDLARIEQQGIRAKQKLVAANMRLVVNIAQKFQRRGMEMLDLIQEGAIGLNRAAEKFNPTRGYKFSTYSYLWIRQAMGRAITDKANTIRQPIHIYERKGWILRARRELLAEFHAKGVFRNPTLQELTDRVNQNRGVSESDKKKALKPSQIEEILLKDRRVCSLDVLVGDERETRLEDLISDRPSGHTLVDDLALQEEVDLLLGDLLPNEIEVILLRHGILTGKTMSQERIGQTMGGFKKQQIQMIESEAMAKIRSKRRAIGV